MNLAIIIPDEYRCSSLVIRKLKRILKNRTPNNVYVKSLQHSITGDIREFLGISIETLNEIQAISHVIVFADQFSLTEKDRELIKQVPNSNIRNINIPVTRVINIKRKHSQAVLMNSKYIGRMTMFGNPYSKIEAGTKAEACRLFQYDFERESLPRGLKKEIVINELQGRHLACSCKPSICHGDIYVEFLNRIDHETQQVN